MKLLFAHDHRFRPFGDLVLSTSFPANIWDRYLAHFDEITVVARQGVQASSETARALSVSSRGGVRFRFVPNLSTPLSFLRQRRVAESIIREECATASAVIARLPSEVGLLSIEVARDLGIPYAVEIAGCPWNNLTTRGGWQGKVYAPIMWLRMRKAVAASPYALYVTQRYLQQRYPCRKGRSGACSNVEIDTPTKEILSRRLERISLGEGKFIFGVIASLSNKLKGLHIALQALSKAKSNLCECEFRILGPGDITPWRRLAEKLDVADLVLFSGTLPQGDAVMSWLDDIDLYIQPSLAEGLPRALIEAMSRGCPALGTTVGGIPELLDTNALYEPSDVNALADLLGVCSRSKEWRIQQAERNWRKAHSYARDVLRPRRQMFWEEFAEYSREYRAREYA